ncbi:MAG: hypothetical protein AAFP79_07085 [Pseudomonadota bacterium]
MSAIDAIIRFNTHDITHELDGRGEITFKRIAGFKGRSDNMVKLRGISVFPHAIGAIIENRPDLTGEYVCHLRRDEAQKDHMTVTLESRGGRTKPRSPKRSSKGWALRLISCWSAKAIRPRRPRSIPAKSLCV